MKIIEAIAADPEMQTGEEQSATVNTSKKSLSWAIGWLQVFGLAVLLVVLCFGWAYLQCGSLLLAPAYLRGERLLVSPAELALGEQEPGELVERTVKIINLADTDVRLLGAQHSCSCVRIDGFPMTIAPGETREVAVLAEMPSVARAFEERAKFFSDYRGRSTFVVTITAQVRERGAAASRDLR